MTRLPCLGLALTALAAPAVVAQDPGAEHPFRRAVLELEVEPARLLQAPDEAVASFCAQGFAFAEGGWEWEARRSFREVTARAPDWPIGWLGLAVVSRSAPRLAADTAWQACKRIDGAGYSGRQVVGAYLDYFGARSLPEPADPFYDAAPPAERRVALLERLGAIAKADGGGGPARVFLDHERWFDARTGADAEVRAAASTGLAAQLRAVHHYLARECQIPLTVPGYAALHAEHHGPDSLLRLPRHPLFEAHYAAASAAGIAPSPVFAPGWSASPDDGSPQPTSWKPHRAPGFDLVRGLGGRGKFETYSGKPVLVVFFLGFGCVHCVAQLGDLDPLAPRFEGIGIDVITIGTDDANAVKAARQNALENGVDPMHMDVLCDPAGDTFKRWGAWDEFTDEALHGTFLVDAQGRILWQDIGTQPFMDSEFLLAESQRLLEVWPGARDGVRAR